jgi:hypothetical protein
LAPEIDLLFERGGVIELAVEIKRSTAPVLSQGFHLACEVLKPKARYLVHGGTESWPLGREVTAVTVSELATRLQRNQINTGGRSRLARFR